MIRSPSELSKPIDSAVNKRAVILSHILMAVTITAHTFLAPDALFYQRIVAIIIFIVVIGLIFFRVFDLARINSKPRVYLFTYSLIAFIGYAFISDASTPYTAGVFLLVFLYNLYYGSRGVIFVVGFFTFTSIVKYIYLSYSTPFSYSDKLNIIVAVAVFVATCSLFINIQKVYDWDRERLRDTLKVAAVEQKRLRVLINNMTESVLVLDKGGIIRLYNAAVLALFNTNNSLSDKPLDGIVKFEDEKGGLITTADLLPKNDKPITRSDINIRYSQEDTASLIITSTPIRSTFGQELGEEEGYIITMRDITRDKSLEQERDEFISVISHELRTPVSVVEGGVSNAMMLSSKIPGNEKVIKSLQYAHDQSVFLANILNDLTTFARAEKGTLDQSVEKYDPRKLMDNLLKVNREIVQAKGMRIVTDIDTSTPLSMVGNRLFIQEILQNYVSNSIKYSDTGQITLHARAKDKGILFSVVDQGIGISVSDQKKLFEKFFRTEDYRTRSTSGTGLGLYIVKKLAKILDARYGVSSEVGKGSNFWLYVPDKSNLLGAKNTALPNAAPQVPVPAGQNIL